MSKEIKLSNGAVIRRTPGEHKSEIWEIENNALATVTITLDLTKSVHCEVEGHPGEKKVSASASPMEKWELFKILRSYPFIFWPDFTMKETPISMEEQEEYLKPLREQLEVKIDAIQEAFQNLPFEVLEEDDIKEKLREKGFDHYIDPSFPPNEGSLWSKDMDDDYPLEDNLPVWKRPKEFMEGTPCLFEEGIEPNDINQGGLGDWWFLASIAAIAENPALVKRLFITQEYNEEGIYRLKVCKNGEWIIVNIDDYIPCYYNGGPVFATNRGNELWVVLLEKAYAKIHGNYCQLRAGFNSHGLNDLTGCPTIDYQFPRNHEHFEEIQDYANNLWDTLTVADVKGHMICAATPGIDYFTEGDGPEEEKGIVGGHAYSVIACRSYKGVRLMKIRNPWGDFEWGGKWSDESEEWTQEYIDAFEPNFDHHDGTFWISFEDFMKHFWGLTICKVQNWYETWVKGKFIKLKATDEYPIEDRVLSKFFYTFYLREEANIEIWIHQEDDRFIGVDRRRHLDLNIIVLKRKHNGTLSVIHDSGIDLLRDINISLELTCGHYIVMPRTGGGRLDYPSNAKIYKEIPFKVDVRGKEKTHALYKSTFNDIFNKLDLSLNGQISADELNQFGEIIDNEVFKEWTIEDFFLENFWKISCDENGITRYGFHQILDTWSEDEVKNMLSKLGYDKFLYSLKSRMFTITFHSTCPLTVEVKDSMDTDMNERCWDLMMRNHYRLHGATKSVQDDRVVIFRREDEFHTAYDFAAINKTDRVIKVGLNLANSDNLKFSPANGMIETVVPPKSLVYLMSACVDIEYYMPYLSCSFASKFADE